MGFCSPEVIASDGTIIIPDATLYHFGVLTSALHMAWVRHTCGRLEMRYRYSAQVVYNNFPWPENPTDAQREAIAVAAQAVLDARAHYPDSSLADLYDSKAMPKDLREAHRKLDRIVDRTYRPEGFANELARVEWLFELYRQKTEPLHRDNGNGHHIPAADDGDSLADMADESDNANNADVPEEIADAEDGGEA